MEFIVIAFRSRAETVRFSEFVRKNGVYCQIINTPKEAGVGCGLSVRMAKSDYAKAARAVRIVGFGSFAGIFLVGYVGGKRFVRSI